MTARPFVVFCGLDWARMAIVVDEVGAYVDAWDGELDEFLDRIKAIGCPSPTTEPIAVAA